MGAICIGDLRSLFKSNYVGRLTRSQVVAFQIPKSVATTGVPSVRKMSWERDAFAYGIELFHSGSTTPPGDSRAWKTSTKRKRWGRSKGISRIQKCQELISPVWFPLYKEKKMKRHDSLHINLSLLLNNSTFLLNKIILTLPKTKK